jgi:DNA topoisomerase-1
VQLGEGEKPKRSSIPKGTGLSEVDFEMALKLLSLPREVGKHPETGNPITANFGRFGPYVKHDGQFASLDSEDEVFTVGLNRAVSVLAEKKSKGRGPRGPEALKELGSHPESGAMVKVMKGRYGPYVADGNVNATLPREMDPMTVTLDQAVALLADRVAKGGGKKPKKAKAAAKPKAKPKTAAKKTDGKTAAVVTTEAKSAAAKPKPKPKAKPKRKPAPVDGG